MSTETKTFYPGAYDTSDYAFETGSFSTGFENPVGKGSDNSGTRAEINMTLRKNAVSYIYWPFDVSAIQEDATIDSVSCKARLATETAATSNIATATAQLYAGSIAKGSAVSFLTTTPTVFNLSVGTWTRNELASCRLRLYGKRGANGVYAVQRLYFYGADLTVTYTYQSEKFMLKLGGAWHDVARVFKKVNGIWVEQTELSSVVDTDKRLVNGGEITS